MNKHCLIPLLLVIFLFPSDSFGQRWKLKRYEASVGVGTTHAFMDIAPPTESIRAFQFIGSRPNGSLAAAFDIYEPLELCLDLSYLMLGGTDSEDHLYVKSFTTHAFEQSLTLKYSFLQGGKAFGTTAMFNRRGMVNNYGSADIYLFGGIGGVLSKATIIDDNDVEVNTGARGVDNNMHYNLVFPVGAGFEYSITAWWSLGVEVSGRITFADYIDGFATENSQYNDSYLTTNIRAIYKIRSDRRGYPILSRYGFRR